MDYWVKMWLEFKTLEYEKDYSLTPILTWISANEDPSFSLTYLI